MQELGRTPDPSTVLGTREHAAALTKGRHPGVRDALQWLAFSHLPEALQNYSRPFYQTAIEMIVNIPSDSPELITTLDKLVEAKDAGVRAGIKSDTGRAGPVSRPATVVNPPVFERGDSVSVVGQLPNHPDLGRLTTDRPQA